MDAENSDDTAMVAGDMRRITQLFCGSFLLTVGLSTASWACSCLHQANCGVKRYGDSDFVGEVLSRRIEAAKDQSDVDRVVYQVRVTENFRGDQRVGDVVTVRTGFGGGDCGYRFKIGSKYLIDASNRNQSLTTGICSLTAPVEDSEVELRSLRLIAAGQHPPDLTGVLMHGTETEDGETLRPLSGVPVQAKRIGGQASATASTDAFGSFIFPRLTEGTYQLLLGIPANLSPAYAHGGMVGDNEIPTVSIVNKDGGPLACHVLVVVEQAGSIRGVVQYPGGTPIEGWVNADTVNSDDQPWNTVRNAVPGPDGKFVLPHLKAGRYSVQFTSRKGFVPGGRQIVELKDGERRTGVTLTAK